MSPDVPRKPNPQASGRGRMFFAATLAVLTTIGTCHMTTKDLLEEPAPKTTQGSAKKPKPRVRNTGDAFDELPTLGCSAGGYSELETDGTLEGTQEAVLAEVAKCIHKKALESGLDTVCTTQELEYQANLKVSSLKNIEVITDTSVEMECVSYDSNGNPNYVQVFMGPVCNQREGNFVGAECVEESNAFFVSNTPQDPWVYKNRFEDALDHQGDNEVLFPVDWNAGSVEEMIPSWEAACEAGAELLVASSAKTDRAEWLYKNLDQAFDLLDAAGIHYEEPADRDFFGKPGLYDMVQVAIPATAPDGGELKCEYFHLPDPNERFGLTCGSTDQLDPIYCASSLFPSLEQIEGNPGLLLDECDQGGYDFGDMIVSY